MAKALGRRKEQKIYPTKMELKVEKSKVKKKRERFYFFYSHSSGVDKSCWGKCVLR